MPHLCPHVNATHDQQRAQLWEAILLHGGDVALDDLVRLPRQLPRRAHYHPNRPLPCANANSLSVLQVCSSSCAQRRETYLKLTSITGDPLRQARNHQIRQSKHNHYVPYVKRRENPEGAWEAAVSHPLGKICDNHMQRSEARALGTSATLFKGHPDLLLQRQHQQWQREHQRLATAGEGHSYHVPPRQDCWQALQETKVLAQKEGTDHPKCVFALQPLPLEGIFLKTSGIDTKAVLPAALIPPLRTYSQEGKHSSLQAVFICYLHLDGGGP